MKLQARFLLLFVFLSVAVGLVLVLQRSLDLDRSRFVLQNELTQRHSYFTKITTTEGHPLDSMSRDYSFWDEMVNFVKTRDLSFAQDNIDTGLDLYGAHAAWVYRPDTSLVYTKASDGHTAPEQLGLPKPFFDQLSAERLMHFYLNTTDGVMEIRAATIHPGDDSERKTTPQGYWIIGRFLDDEYITKLSNLTQSELKLGPGTAETIDRLDKQAVSFGTQLKSWDGQSVAVITSTASVPVVKDLETLYLRQLVLLLTFTVASILVVMISIWWLVLRPVRLITESLKSQNPSSLNALAKEKTEFGGLARTIQQFFSSEFVKSKLMDLNTAKSEFLAIAAHELKSPVGNVHLFAENLLDLLGDNATKESLQTEIKRISQQAHKATVLINDIYQASKGGQALDIKRTEFDYDSFIATEVENAQYSTRQKLIVEGTAGHKVNSDIDRLGQVMTNLIRNASKYSPQADKIVIHIKLENNAIVTEVEDFGLGISPEDQAKLFDRFFRSTAVATTYPGLGLGLSICKEIVEALGGRIWLTSELGKGSHFFFSLPVSSDMSELS